MSHLNASANNGLLEITDGVTIISFKPVNAFSFPKQIRDAANNKASILSIGCAPGFSKPSKEDRVMVLIACSTDKMNVFYVGRDELFVLADELDCAIKTAAAESLLDF